MKSEQSSPAAYNYFLDQGYILVSKRPAIISAVLGSCVSVCIYDRKRKMGGMNHFQFPWAKDRHKATARYGNVAIRTLLQIMHDSGSKSKHLEAQIIGGAHNRDVSYRDIGRENLKAARDLLIKRGIAVTSEDTGGEKGRKVVFNTETNELAVVKVDRLRIGDWFPYENGR